MQREFGWDSDMEDSSDKLKRILIGGKSRAVCH